MIAVARPARIADEIAAHLGRPWAGYVRAVGARLTRSPQLEIRTAFGDFIALPNDHTLQHPSFFEGFESALVARLIDPGMTVVDIGANRGWYTAMAAHLVGDDGLVIAVEPDARMRDRLQRTVDHNGWRHRVVVEDRAISDATGEQAWHAAAEGSLSHLVVGTADPDAGSTTVTTVTLNDMLAEHGAATPGFIKIDVEGAEFRVFEGCRFEQFGGDLPTILFEFQPEMIERADDRPRDLLDLLWSAGYALFQLQPEAGLVVPLDREGDLPDSSIGRNLLAIGESKADELIARLVIADA